MLCALQDAHQSQHYLIPNSKNMTPQYKTTYTAEFLHMFRVRTAADTDTAPALGVGTAPASGVGKHPILLQLEPGDTVNGVVWPKVSTEVSIARDLSAKPPFTLHLLKTRVMAMNQRLVLAEVSLCHVQRCHLK